MGTEAFLDNWHRIVAERDKQALAAVLDAEVVLGAPPYWNRLEGRDLVAFLLGVILDTIEDFTYHRELRSERDLALEFRGTVDDLALQGIDLITLGDDGLVTQFDVMIRPINAVIALRERVAPHMTAYIESLA